MSERYYVPDAQYSIAELMKKEVQGQIALSCGLRIPDGIIVHPGTDFVWDKYPCITKPGKSVQGKGKADIHVAANQDELRTCLREIEADEVQIQEYIKKKMEFQLIGCSLNNGDMIFIPGFTSIIRQPMNTNTGYLQYSPIQQLQYNQEAVKKFIRKTGYSGLFSVEFLRDENDNDYFLEMNMRNDGNAYCVKSAGVNLPYLWCYYQVNNVLPQESLEAKESVYFIPDFLDMKAGIKRVGIIKWIAQFFGAKSHSLYNTKDMKPFMFDLHRRIVHHIKVPLKRR